MEKVVAIISIVTGVIAVLGFVAGTFFRMGRYGNIIGRFDRWMHEINNWKNTLETNFRKIFPSKELTDAQFENLGNRVTSLESRMDKREGRGKE